MFNSWYCSPLLGLRKFTETHLIVLLQLRFNDWIAIAEVPSTLFRHLLSVKIHFAVTTPVATL